MLAATARLPAQLRAPRTASQTFRACGGAGRFAKPYTIKRVAQLAQGYDIYEFICSENERDVAHMVAK
jgi:hypothetical protein